MSKTRLLAVILAVGLLQFGARFQAAGQREAGRPDSSQPQEAAPGQAPPPAESQQPPQQPTFRTGINFVRVDVIVTGRNAQPVIDLTQSDFEVQEDGRPQTIEQFRLIRVDGNAPPGDLPPRQIRSRADEELEAGRDDVRVFVFFLDDYHTRLQNAVTVRDPLTSFIQTQLGPNDLVGLMYPLTPVDQVSLTRNHASVITAIQRFEGRKFRYEPRNEFEQQYAQYPTETVEQIRNQVVMGALRGLSTRLGSLREGRKAIIYVSEGLTAMLPPQMRDPVATMPGFGNPTARRSRPIVENNPREETAGFFAEADLYSQLREVFGAANRNNAAIYTVDPRGLAVNEYSIDEQIGQNLDRRALQVSQDTLRSLAAETDGRSLVNRNDLSSGLAQIVRDSSAYYLIGYNSAQAPTDGKFHEIRVRVRRPGVDVRARKGYWAATAEDVIRASTPAAPTASKPVQQALASIAPAVQSSRYVRTWVGTAKGENGNTRVTFVWEPLPGTPGVRRDQPGRVALTASGANGTLVFRGRVPDNNPAPPAATPGAASRTTTPAPRAGAAPASTALGPQRIVFDAPPGRMELRIGVEAIGGGLIDSEIQDIVVPDLGASSGYSTPRVYRARTARDFQAIAKDADAVPTAGREFSRADRLLLRFDVYGGATPVAALLNRNGQKMADVPVGPAVVGGTHQIDFGLGAIPPGEYLIEISLTESTKELVALRVVS
jgi:VWFA-related protein